MFKFEEMVILFKHSESSLSYLSEKMAVYIERRGVEMALQRDAIEFTKAFLSLLEEVDNVVEHCFDNHPMFQLQREQSFRTLINKNQLSASFFADYCDSEMRKGWGQASEQETEKLLKAIIQLFQYLQDRDIFIKLHTHYLAIRLLDYRVSYEIEQRLFAMLEIECGGYGSLRTVSGAFTEIHRSEKLAEEFRRDNRGAGLIDLEVRVLREEYLQKLKIEHCTVPKELLQCVDRFEGYFGAKFPRRRLTWLLGHGQCELMATFTAKPYTFIVTPYQAAILLLFNYHTSLNINQIQKITNLKTHTIETQLAHFFDPGSRLLVKQSPGYYIGETDIISVWADFTCSTLTVNFVPKQTYSVFKREKQLLDFQIEEHYRKYKVDCALMCIAKRHSTISHEELLAEVKGQITFFQPRTALIELQIESLILRKCLKRGKSDPAIYTYIP